MHGKTRPSRRMKIPGKYWLVVLAIPLVLVTGDFLYWRTVTARLNAGLQQWVAAQAAQGWEISLDKPSLSGWPRAAMVRVPNMTLHHAGPALPGDVTVASDDVVLSVSLFTPDSLRLSLLGPTHVRLGQEPRGDARAAGQDLVLTGDDASLSIPMTESGPLSAAFHGSGLRLGPAAGAWQVTVGLLNAAVTFAANPSPDQSEPSARFAMTAEAIALPAGFKWPLGSHISSLSLDGELNGPLPKTRDITRWAEAWRDGGGSLEIKHLAVGWGPLGLASSATIALDEQLQPMGSGSGRIVGYADTLDRLAAGGVMTKSAATAAKAVLSLLAGTTDADEPSAVDVPLTLQYRTLSMRQVPLVRLPELDWPP
jgi:hypothetical protein